MNKKRYRVIRDESYDYLVDTNSYWWSFLLGVFIWSFPLVGYRLVNPVQYKHSCTILQRIAGILTGVIGLIVLVFCSVFIDVTGLNFSIQTKILFCVFTFVVIYAWKIVKRNKETKRFMRENMMTENSMNRIRISINSKRYYVKLFFFNVFLQGLMGILLPILCVCLGWITYYLT
ncbi:MAG: DUF443 family protein [Hespellia sp.]|nr:DUF443 family protein [Hespellia sp.]